MFHGVCTWIAVRARWWMKMCGLNRTRCSPTRPMIGSRFRRTLRDPGPTLWPIYKGRSSNQANPVCITWNFLWTIWAQGCIGCKWERIRRFHPHSPLWWGIDDTVVVWKISVRITGVQIGLQARCVWMLVSPSKTGLFYSKNVTFWGEIRKIRYE